jgi:hypothetical protein
VSNCIVHIIDLMPQTIHTLVSLNGVGELCKKLKNIEATDFCENAIKILEKVSFSNANSILKADAFDTLIMIMDFFVASV